MSLSPTFTSEALSAQELKTFIDATLRYFEKVTGEPAEIGDALIQFDAPPVFDFTGLIQISGAYAGFFYVTMERLMLAGMLASVGEHTDADEACLDFAGEIANTISSNARQIFRRSFNISIPISLPAEAAVRLFGPATSFVLPVTWRKASARIVIALQHQ